MAAADFAGRPPLPPKPFEAGQWLRERASQLDVADSAPEPLLTGRHLIEMGLEPGPQFKEILDACYEAQLDGGVATVKQARSVAERLVGDSVL